MPPDADRLRLTTLQYEAIRAESNQTRQDQQSILNWNQALAIALFAAGFVATGQNGNVLIGRILYGAVLPTVLLGGALAWAGEMIRMERTGVYLRALERSMWYRTDSDETLQTNWFIWENILWAPPERWHAGGYRKQSIGYSGIAIFYAVMYVASFISFMSLSSWWLSLIDATTLIVVGVALMFPVARQVFLLGGMAPSISDEELSEWAKGLPERKGLGDQAVLLRYLMQLLIWFARLLARRRNRSNGSR